MSFESKRATYDPLQAPIQGREGFPLRPEFIESTVYLYQATKDPVLLEIGAEFLFAINKTARTDCGFATVDNVLTGVRADRMESFYIAELEFENQPSA